MTEAELRSSGFKRILVRLDEGTRRKYCSKALAEDLEKAQSQMSACVAAMKQARQVEEATRKLDEAQGGVKSTSVTGLLSEVEALFTQLESATTALLSCNGDVKTEQTDKGLQQAKTLVKQVLQTDNAEDVDAAVDRVKQLEKLMPIASNVDERRQKWWRKHVQKVVDHLLAVVKNDAKTMTTQTQRLLRVAKKVAAKCPSLTDWFEGLEIVVKGKKKRLIALPDDGETAVTTASTPTKRAKTSNSANGSANKESKEQSIEKTRSLLHRCSREVKTLRDKFNLEAYDANLSRAVTIVDSLWPGFNHSELVLLTTALFTLVETTEKIAMLNKRRDRLVCLESVLGVVLGNSTLKMSTRRKTMIEEYANNCRQSLEQLNRPPESNAPEASPSEAVASISGKDDRTTLSKQHVRF